jgi:hypothetical protein
VTSLRKTIWWLVGTAELGLIVWSGVTEGLAQILLALLLLIAVVAIAWLATTKWPLGAIALLIASSVTGRFEYTIGGVHVRLEQVATVAVLLAVFLRVRTWMTFRPNKTDYAVILYILLNFVTSGLTSPNPHQTLRWAALNALVIAPYFLLRILANDSSKVRSAWRVFCAVISIECLYGVISFLCNQILGTAFGVEAAQYGDIPGTFGTHLEANLFGSYSAAGTLIFLVIYLVTEERPRKLVLASFAISVAAAFISLSRAVFFALPISALFTLWVVCRKHHTAGRRVKVLAALAVVTIASVSPLVLGLAKERLSTINQTDIAEDETTFDRLIQMKVALDDIQAHPLLGTGTASFQLFFDWGDFIPGGDQTTPVGWVGNMPLRILHDTGAIGFITFIVFIVLLCKLSLRALRQPKTELSKVVLALLLSLTLYAITFQSTEATGLSFTWIHLGLLASAANVTGAQNLHAWTSTHA